MATHDHTGNADEITPQARTLTDRNAIDEYLDTIQGRGGGTSWAEQCELP
jgi:hypothetical protein